MNALVISFVVLLSSCVCVPEEEPVITCRHTPHICFPDAAPRDALDPIACNPLDHAGCSAGEKCTWFNDQDNPPRGHLGCAPNGTIPIGGACIDPPAGPKGYDDCARGSVCLSGACKQICHHQGGAPTCDADHACATYPDFLEDDGTSLAGVCEPGCDPLTQDRLVGGNTTACGSPNPAMPSQGCYGYDEFRCAPSGVTTWARTDRTLPRTSPSGNPYVNGCAPGFMPLFFEGTGSTVTLCTGLCSAIEVDNTTIDGLSPEAREDGDPGALGKLPASPTPFVGGATCDETRKGSEPSSTCRFLWPYLVNDATGELPLAFEQSRHRDTLGVCIAIAHFQYDSNNDLTPDAPYPSCTTLPRRSSATPGGYDDAADWGCQKRASSAPSFAGGPHVNGVSRNVRLALPRGLGLVRHDLQ